ncbi:MAG: tetratricopeptide repeat protein [Deltaproteobacteria bacterium]|nr:tetratricopeptide repeat protein [Deltaproteobacteria bacterium]
MLLRAELEGLLAKGGRDGADVVHAALLLEKEERPAILVDKTLNELARWADTIDRRLGGARAPVALAETISSFLFNELGFRPNREAYYQPANSHLSQVVERRLGIPISLSLIYLGIGHRLQTPMAGIGFPGHFLLRIGDERKGILADPFGLGRVLDRASTEALLHQYCGAQAQLSPSHLQALSPRGTLARMQRNLKLIYLRENNFQAALDATDRIVFLLPEDPEEHRDRGLLFERLECFGAAQKDYETYLDLAPTNEDVPLIRERLVNVGAKAARVN